MREQTLIVYCETSTTCESPSTMATPPRTASPPTPTGNDAAVNVRKTRSRTSSASGMETSSARTRSCSRIAPRSARNGILPVQVMVRRSLRSLVRSSGQAARPSSSSPRSVTKASAVRASRLWRRAIIGAGASSGVITEATRGSLRSGRTARRMAAVISGSVGSRSADSKRMAMEVSSRRPVIASTTLCARFASSPLTLAPARRPPRTSRSTDRPRKIAEASSVSTARRWMKAPRAAYKGVPAGCSSATAPSSSISQVE